MSEKTAKLIRKETPVMVARITIDLLNNGQVTVNGPLNDVHLFRDMMNKGDRAAIEYQAREASRIVIPDLKVKMN